MFELKNLPRIPEDALIVLLNELLKVLPGQNSEFAAAFHRQSSIQVKLKTLVRAAAITAARVNDEEVRKAAIEHLVIDEEGLTADLRRSIKALLDLILASQLDEHFINPQDITDFDTAILDDDDKSKIRELLATARKLTEEANFLSEDHKRRVLTKIALVENELFKEKSRWQTFVFMAEEGSKLFRRFGEDAKPLAEAIETARTITERKVEGNKLIEAEEKPKQIEGPKD